MIDSHQLPIHIPQEVQFLDLLVLQKRRLRKRLLWRHIEPAAGSILDNRMSYEADAPQRAHVDHQPPPHRTMARIQTTPDIHVGMAVAPDRPELLAGTALYENMHRQMAALVQALR